MDTPQKGYLFENVNVDKPNKSAFDLSHRSMMSAQFDYLYPIFTHHCLPGETYEMNMKTFFRTTPLTAPTMANIDVKIYWFWIPYRVIFRQWRRFISNGDGTRAMNSTDINDKYCDWPIVTDKQLALCGNYSYTSHFRNLYHWDTTTQGAPQPINWNRFLEPQKTLTVHSNNGPNHQSGTVYTNGIADGSLADYLGIHVNYSDSITNNQTPHLSSDWRETAVRTFSSLPFRAYNKIWYDWFRDENYMANPNETVPLRYMYLYGNDVKTYQHPTYKIKIWNEDTDYYRSANTVAPFHDDLLNVGLLRKCWSRDYFTTALPSPQRGGEILLPLGDTAPINYLNNGNPDTLRNPSSGVKLNGDRQFLSVSGNLNLQLQGSNAPANLDNSSHLIVDLRNASSSTLNSLRVANAMQKFVEKLGRSGSRYIESMAMLFDTDVPDCASNRCTLISTDRIPLQIQTNSSESAVQIDNNVIPQGNLCGNASGSGSNGFKLTTDEHGMIMGIMNISPSTLYCSAMSRDWYRRQPLDFAYPDFAHLGEQPVYSYEVMPIIGIDDTLEIDDADSTLSAGDLVAHDIFGYQSRYAEYKFVNDEVHGRFLNDFNYWHLGRFNNEVYTYTAPQSQGGLHQSQHFLLSNVEDYQNIFNEVMDNMGNTADHFLFDFDFNFKGIRPLPLYGTPTL